MKTKIVENDLPGLERIYRAAQERAQVTANQAWDKYEFYELFNDRENMEKAFKNWDNALAHRDSCEMRADLLQEINTKIDHLRAALETWNRWNKTNFDIAIVTESDEK